MRVIAVEVNAVARRTVRLEHVRGIKLPFLPLDEHVLADAVRLLARDEQERRDEREGAPPARAARHAQPGTWDGRDGSLRAARGVHPARASARWFTSTACITTA